MAKRKAKEMQTVENVLDVAVQWGNVSIGDGVARLTATIDRESLDLLDADLKLCGHRLTGSVSVLPAGDHPDQQELIDTGNRHVIEGTFDVKRIGVSPKKITAGLAFSIGDIEIGELALFAKRSGRLIATGVAPLPADGEHEHEEQIGEDDE